MIKAIVTAVATVVAWFFSPERREAQKALERVQTRREIESGDEDAVNARIKQMVVLVVAIGLCGCSVFTRTCYVREQDRVRAIRPGGIYTNESDVVEWAVPPTILLKLMTKE